MNLMSMLLKFYPAQADYKNLEIHRNYYVAMWLKTKPHSNNSL